MLAQYLLNWLVFITERGVIVNSRIRYEHEKFMSKEMCYTLHCDID